MWRRINENEKQYLLNRMKSGMGIKIILLFFIVFLFRRIMAYVASGMYEFIFIFLLIFVLTVVASICSLKARRDKKLCIEKQESLVCEGIFVSYQRLFERQNRNQFVVDIQVYDSFNNCYYTYKAKYMGRSYEIEKLNVGDRMLVIKLLPNQENLRCIECSAIERVGETGQ